MERWIKKFLKPLTFVLKHSLEQDLVNHVRVNVFLSAECTQHLRLLCLNKFHRFITYSFNDLFIGQKAIKHGNKINLQITPQKSDLEF